MRTDPVTAAEASLVESMGRWERVRDALVLGMFVLTILLGLGGEPEVRGGRPWMFVLSVLFILWYTAMYSRTYQRAIAGRRIRALAYVLAGVTLWLMLIILDGPYLMYLFVLLSTTYTQLPFRWATGACTGMAVIG